MFGRMSDRVLSLPTRDDDGAGAAVLRTEYLPLLPLHRARTRCPQRTQLHPATCRLASRQNAMEARASLGGAEAHPEISRTHCRYLIVEC